MSSALQSAAPRALEGAGERIASLRGWRRSLLALAGGAALTLAQPPLGLWAALFLGWPTALWLLAGAQNGRVAARLGWLFGFGYFLTGLYWVGEAFLAEGGRVWWYVPLMPIAIAALAATLALFWAAAFWVVRLADARGLGRALALGAAIGAAELARGGVLTGFPWALQAYAWIDTPVFQNASLIGSYALSAFTIAAAATAGLLLAPGRRMAGLAPLALLALAWSWGELRLRAAEPIAPGAPILRLVQPNVPQSEKWRPENALPIFENLLELTAAPAAGPAPALVVWPEAAAPFILDAEPEALRRATEALPEGASLAAGAIRYAGEGRGVFGDTGAEGRPYNSLQFFDPQGAPVAVYDKRHLTPFGEYVPYADVLEPLGLRALARSFGGFGLGSRVASVDLPGLPPLAPLICYEIIFPLEVAQAAEGAAWMLQVTNDAWFGRSAGPHQHLAQARARAVEQGLPVARAANTGVSAMIDSHGRLLATLPLDRRGALDSSLPPPAAPTLYARLRGWMEAAALLLLGASAIMFTRQKRMS